MPIRRLDDFPSNSGNLSADDIFLFMDDPSGSGITKQVSLSDLASVIGTGSGLGITINDYSNNRLLTSDGTSTGIDAESALTFDGHRLRIDCTCESGTAGLTLIGDQRSTSINSNVYSDPISTETEDGILTLRANSRLIFLGTRGSAASPSGLDINDTIFTIRGDAYNPYGTLNSIGNLDNRTLRIRGYISDSGNSYLGSSLEFQTSSGSGLYDHTLKFDHNGVLSIDDNPIVSGSYSQPYLELTNKAFIVLPAVLGSGISFVRTAEGSETDPISSGLTLARGSVGALYNSETQLEYNNTTHAIDGAEWNADGWGDLLNTTTRSYGTLRSVLNNQIGNYIVGSELIMHDTINDQYYKFLFNEWGENNGGSFAYTRTLISDPNPNFFEKINYGSEIDTFVADSPEGSGVGITRGNNQGIYNPYQEEGWNENVSPLGTEWNTDGWDNISDIASRTYTNFYDAVGQALGNNVPGSQLIMRLTGTQTYYAIQFINWTQGGNGGGFSYLKYQINLDELQEGITFSDGTVLKSADGIGRVKSTASNNRRIEEVYGSKTVSVTQITTNEITSSFSRSGNGNAVWIDITTTNIDEVMSNPSASGIIDYSTIQFSLDNNTWYTWNGSTGFDGNERQYGLNTTSFSHTSGDPVYFRYNTGGEPQIWWDKNQLPGGAANFRGAVIDYHCYTGEGTFIGTIHIVDDDGEENITHSEVSSGSTDSENDDLWFIDPNIGEGTISYRRMDGESKTAKFHWGAKVFYGSELYD